MDRIHFKGHTLNGQATSIRIEERRTAQRVEVSHHATGRNIHIIITTF